MRFPLFFAAALLFLASAVPLDFAGPQLDVPVANLTGWSSCYKYAYSEDGILLDDLLTTCVGTRFMFACGQVQTDIYDVVLSADYSFILSLNNSLGSIENGAFWYRENSKGIGFADGVFNLQPCDIDTPGQREALCWQLDSTGKLIIGGRCSGAVALGAGSTLYYRELLFDPCTGQSDGTPCDDNNLCTTNTTCQNQECVGVPTTPPAVPQCYEVGECDPKTGIYEVVAEIIGIPCDDGDLCTQADVCDGAGTCVGGTGVVCASVPGQCYAGGTCNPGTGLCDYPFRPFGSTCDDGLYCTTPDVCDGAGTCIGNGNRTCLSYFECRDPGYCDELADDCVYPISANYTPCVIQDACVNTSVCLSGVCTIETGVVCPPPTQCQISATCNSNTGQCDIVNKADGTACDDGDLCTLFDECNAGVCGGTPVVCTSAGPCYDVGTCNPGTGICSNPFSPNTKPCTDGNACTSPDLCDGAGSCIPGAAVTCSAIGQCDVAAICNPSYGCAFTPKADGSPCNDGNICTLDDECISGTCQPGPLDLYNEYCFPDYTTGGTDACNCLRNVFDEL